MQNETLFSMFQLHARMQEGTYFSGVEAGPDGALYCWSDLIPDASWNVACSPSPPNDRYIEWLRKISAAKHRSPNLLLGHQNDLPPPLIKEAIPEHWMVMGLRGLKSYERPSIARFEVTKAAQPSSDFLAVFTRLFDDAINQHFERTYAPALRGASCAPDVLPIHMVGYSTADQPVACASVYIVGKIAGLYNVGTLAAQQKSGFGREISVKILALAQNEGCADAMLQCETNTHVARLYEKIGFTYAHSPAGVTLRDA